MLYEKKYLKLKQGRGMNRAEKREDINIAYGVDGHLFHVEN